MDILKYLMKQHALVHAAVPNPSLKESKKMWRKCQCVYASLRLLWRTAEAVQLALKLGMKHDCMTLK